jgi:hypothetical protein
VGPEDFGEVKTPIDLLERREGREREPEPPAESRPDLAT